MLLWNVSFLSRHSHCSHLSHIVWGDAWPQHSQLDSVLPAVVMAAEELGQWSWEVSIVSIVIIKPWSSSWIFSQILVGDTECSSTQVWVSWWSHVITDHWSGPAARGGDVLQTEAWLVPGPSLPLRAGPGGEVSNPVTHGRKFYFDFNFNLMLSTRCVTLLIGVFGIRSTVNLDI